jgi:L-ascorbate metabolism protein UlaG (beta-lactamase superfamily)
MRIRWYGQSAFLLEGEQTVAIDPFGSFSEGLAERGLVFDYPPVAVDRADMLLITHEHGDHNAAEVVGGNPVTIRSTAGTIESPVGDVVAVASEHDDAAGTKRGPNTIFCFTLNGLRYCHLGDFGQPALRAEQREAIGDVDVLLMPVGGGPTIGGAEAAALVRELAPRLVVPMHYRTEAVNFLDPPDAFLDALGATVTRLESSEAEVDDLLGTGAEPVVALFAPPLSAPASAPQAG